MGGEIKADKNDEFWGDDRAVFIASRIQNVFPSKPKDRVKFTEKIRCDQNRCVFI